MGGRCLCLVSVLRTGPTIWWLRRAACQCSPATIFRVLSNELCWCVCLLVDICSSSYLMGRCLFVVVLSRGSSLKVFFCVALALLTVVFGPVSWLVSEAVLPFYCGLFSSSSCSFKCPRFRVGCFASRVFQARRVWKLSVVHLCAWSLVCFWFWFPPGPPSCHFFCNVGLLRCIDNYFTCCCLLCVGRPWPLVWSSLAVTRVLPHCFPWCLGCRGCILVGVPDFVCFCGFVARELRRHVCLNQTVPLAPNFFPTSVFFFFVWRFFGSIFFPIVFALGVSGFYFPANEVQASTSEATAPVCFRLR